MRREGVTIKDIAREADCASSTVSKFLNGGNIREPHRSRLLRVIQEYGYRPNSIAKSLRSKQSFAVGVLFPDFSNQFAMNIMATLETELNKLGYSALVCSSENDPKIEQKKLEFLLEKQVDGIILIPCHDDGSRIRETVGKDVPVVLMDCLCDGYDTDAILLNNREISAKATERLLSQHTDVAIISSDDSHTGRQRYLGYVDAYEKMGIPIRQEYIKNGGRTIDGGYLQMKQLWENENKPRAVFITNYEMTIGTIMAINEMGIRIPDELQVIGFDYVGLAKALNHELSIVEQPMADMAKMAADLLYERMNGESSESPRHCVLNAKLVDLEKYKL